MTSIYNKTFWKTFALIEIPLLPLLFIYANQANLNIFMVMQIAVLIIIFPMMVLFVAKRITIEKQIPKDSIVMVVNQLKWFKIIIGTLLTGSVVVGMYALIFEGNQSAFGPSFLFIMLATMHPKIIITKEELYFGPWFIEKSDIESFKSHSNNQVILKLINGKTLPVNHYNISDKTYELTHIYKD